MNIHSFCLTAHNSNQIHQLDVDQLNQHFSNEHAQVRFAALPESNMLNVTIKSQHATACIDARGAILRNNPVKTILMIKPSNMLAMHHREIKSSLTDIAKEFNLQIKVNSILEPEIHLIGSMHSVELARVKTLVLLDQLAGLSMDTLPGVPYYLHFLLSGRKHVQLQAIMEETSTNIYLQSPFYHLNKQKERQQEAHNNGLIYLTGESASGLVRAKDLLKKLTAQKVKSMHRKDSNIDPKKIDWILLYQREKLRKIMRDNGSYFEFPLLGSGKDTISIYAENRIYVERSIRLLNHLASSIYEACFDLNNKEIEKQDAIFAQLSQSSGVDVIYQPQTQKIELFGTESQVCNAYRILGDMPIVKENHQFTTFSLELATDQREFVSGKKNGKINKIMKNCGVTIRFTISNEYNSCIIVESTSHTKALEGLVMLQDELPAETSFYVPEIYHRRIIGVAGKNIQKVMKKYGVYVKFSGAEEFTSLGGYFENEDNVVARTPMKNQMNLEHLKLSVTEFIGFQKDKDFVSTTITIPCDLQRIIPSKYGSQLRDICRTNNAKIWWPERLGCESVVVYGPQTQIPSIVAYLTQFIPQEKHLVIDLGTGVEAILSDPGFLSRIQMKIHADLQDIELLHAIIIDQPNYKCQVLEWNSGYFTESDILLSFKFTCHNSSQQNQTFDQAKEIVKNMIESKGISFNELSANEQEPNYISQDVQNHLLPSSILANTPTLPDDPMFDMLDNTAIPSPSLSESYSIPYHPYDNTPFVSSSLLSAPIPTARNIWASPRIQHHNIVPPIIQNGDRMHHINHYPPNMQSSPSPQQHAYQQGFSMPRQMSSPLVNPQQRNIHMRPSTSAPTIGTKQQQTHHKSWPDVFFGGRDLFDTLPSRRASASTQYVFELYPNGTTTGSASSPPMLQQQGYQQNKPLSMMTNKYEQQFNVLAQKSPFVYSNAPPPPPMNGGSLYNNVENSNQQPYTRFNF